jgi:MYXO-CTERM domain-containing protein
MCAGWDFFLRFFEPHNPGREDAGTFASKLRAEARFLRKVAYFGGTTMKLALGFATTGLCLALGVWSGTARAGLSSCGDIDVQADATCQVEVEGGCTAHCAPPQLELACSAQLEASCKGGCTAMADVSCTGSCDLQGCQAKCDVDPGKFDCSAQCQVDADTQCQGECQGKASGSQAHGECVASCKASISAECNASCSGTPPKADCKAKCQATCEGSCTGQARASCQVDCQAKGYARCEGDLKLKCEGECKKPEGALFCDGQYIDHGGKLQDCIDSLDAWLKSHVDVTAQGTASGACTGSACQGQAQGSATASCATVPGGPAGGAIALFGMVLAGAAIARRRRSS